MLYRQVKFGIILNNMFYTIDGDCYKIVNLEYALSLNSVGLVAEIINNEAGIHATWKGI